EPKPAPTPVPVPKPVARPTPQPAPKQAAKPETKPTPKAAPTRSGGRLAGILEGISDQDTPSRSKAPPAATITPAIQSSLAGAIIRQIKPHWEGPSGPDVDAL